MSKAPSILINNAVGKTRLYWWQRSAKQDKVFMLYFNLIVKTSYYIKNTIIPSFNVILTRYEYLNLLQSEWPMKIIAITSCNKYFARLSNFNFQNLLSILPPQLVVTGTPVGRSRGGHRWTRPWTLTRIAQF